MTSVKMTIGMSPYQLVFGKVLQFLVELEHKTLWELKRLNLNLKKVVELRLDQLNEVDEFWLHAYERANLYKE